MKKKSIILLILALLFIYICANSTIGRYIYNGVNNYILQSRGFYFNSTVLSLNNSNYSINNWDGVNPYVLTIDVNNKKNDLVYTTVDISYDISVVCPEKVLCSLNKNSSIIYKDNKTDTYTITITPLDNFYEGDSVKITTTAHSNSPYEKSLSASYTIGVEKSQFSYSIEDSVGSKYMTLKLTNSIPYYEVVNAFDSYSVGDHISLDVYNTLSTENKKNCFSALINIGFDPNIVLLDITNKTYINKIENSLTTVNIDDYNYINGYQFYMDANAHENIIFYKKDSTKNYAYPIINNKSIISVSIRSAN